MERAGEVDFRTDVEKEMGSAAVRGEAVAEPKTIGEMFASVGGWMNGGDLGYPSFGSMDALRIYTQRSIRAAFSARAADAPSEPSELHWREKCAALIDIWDDAQANPPESRCYVEDAWPTMINEVRAELAVGVKSRAADLLDSQHTVAQPDYAALRGTIHELRTYNPAADECHGAHIHKVWADDIESAICEAALVYAIKQLDAQPTVAAQQGSIAADAQFRELLSAWYRGKSGTSRPQKVERDFAALVAYIDSRAPAAPVAPLALDGWKLVSLKATPEMLQAAGYRATAAGNSATGHEVYSRMLAAAPLPQVQSEALDRDAVLEEAAVVCDGKHRTWRWDDADDSASGPRDCAAGIRALKSDQQPVTPSGALADNDGGVAN